MLEPVKFSKQAIDFQKATFGNAFNAISRLQDQSEKLASLALTKAPWFPQEGKKVVDEWTGIYKKSREEFKNTIIDGSDSVKSLLDETTTAAPSETE